MLTFICEKEIRDKVIEEFVAKLAEEIEACEITTLAANHYDSNLTDGSGCDKKELCMGGCPLMPEIVFCDSKERRIKE